VGGYVELVLWLVISLLFILSFIGLVVPIIPGMLLLWIGFLLYQFTLADPGLPPLFWVIALVVTIFIFGSDFYLNFYFVDKFGGSVWSQWGSIIGVLVGFFIFPPFGILLLPLVAVFIIESIVQASYKKALKVTLATVASLISSAFMKGLFQTVLLILFFFYVFK